MVPALYMQPLASPEAFSTDIPLPMWLDDVTLPDYWFLDRAISVRDNWHPAFRAQPVLLVHAGQMKNRA